MSAIQYNQQERVFVLQTAATSYLLKVDGDGRLHHIGHVVGRVDADSLGYTAEYEVKSHFLDRQGSAWEYPAYGDVLYREAAIKVAFPEPGSSLQPGESAHAPIRDLRLRFDSHHVPESPIPILRITLRDPNYAFYLTLCFRVHAPFDVIERWVEVENRCAFSLTIEQLAFATHTLPHGFYTLTFAAGTWGREFNMQQQTLQQGVFTLDHRGLTTGHSSNPFYFLNLPGEATESHGTVWFGALAFSGNWSLRFETQPIGLLRVLGGYDHSEFQLSLAPGEIHVTPVYLCGCSPDGFSGASQRLHSYARAVQPTPELLRPVLYNSWEATYFDISLEQQIQLARLAAGIGVELYCVDDGWFGARRSDRAGLGDWTASQSIFPNGLRPLSDECRQLGMQFGLWVEPEMVNPDSDLYRTHPEWVLHWPGRPRVEERYQLILDLGRREVTEYLFEQLDRLVGEAGIDFFKWDMNRYPSEAGSVVGPAIWRVHALRVYEIMDRLLSRHPQLMIQSCSGGSGRVDFGMMGRVVQFWTSDNTDAYDRVRIQDGFSYAYPPQTMECWVTHEKNHQTGSHASLDYRFDVAMRGVLGIGSSLNLLPADELQAYGKKIAFYKRIRPVVQQGLLYRLKNSAADPTLSVWLSVSKDRKEAVYSSVSIRRPQGAYTARPLLRGLEPESTYRIDSFERQGIYTCVGKQLMALGIPDECNCGSSQSRTLLLVAL